MEKRSPEELPAPLPPTRKKKGKLPGTQGRPQAGLQRRVGLHGGIDGGSEIENAIQVFRVVTVKMIQKSIGRRKRLDDLQNVGMHGRV